VRARDSQFEAIVVGGGPAGAAAAFTLASRGISTCIVDRSKFPRDKLCGGYLTLRSKKVFDGIFKTSWDAIIEGTSNCISVFHRGALLARVNDYSSLFATQRFRFDNFLLHLAKQEGALVQTNKTVVKIDFLQNAIVTSDGSVLKYQYLIGADGVNSVVARGLFGRSFDPNRIGFGLEVTVPCDEVPDFPLGPEVHLGAAKWGYGWVFPKNGHAVLGIGGSYKKNVNLMNRFENFLLQRCGRTSLGRVKGHFLPYGGFRPIPGASNVLLVGDAAGLVDSLTGEGIAFAMQSGHAAALSIVEYTAQGRAGSPLDTYIRRYAEIARLIRLSNRYRPLVFLPIFESFFAKTLVGAGSIQRGYLDIFADEIGYENLPRLMAQQFCRGLFPRRATTNQIGPLP
jgi:geranylgeranyl reductase family protein